jgi:D-sedoheptulose 7-phosphate isomerase
MSMQTHIRSVLEESAAALANLLRNEPALTAIENAAQCLIDAFADDKRVFSCGNGGSMSDAMHFAEELTGRYRLNRRGLPATAISDVGHLTCVANDFGYEQVFSRYIESHGKAGDVLFAISTSDLRLHYSLSTHRPTRRYAGNCAYRAAESALGKMADIGMPPGGVSDPGTELHIRLSTC